MARCTLAVQVARWCWHGWFLPRAQEVQLALQRNRTLVQAAAIVGASRGKALQAALYPNPTIGYDGDRIGAAGTVGELQGGFVQQVIVTIGKLRLSRAKYNQEAYQAELLALTQQYRVLNGRPHALLRSAGLAADDRVAPPSARQCR